MNVFVLGTGRCGTSTFVHACQYVTSHTSAHESLINAPGDARLAYPADHIEADNRLSWMLGRLGETWGDAPLYVHMVRDEEATARSFTKRWNDRSGIIYGYRTTVYPDLAEDVDPMQVARDYCRTVNTNVRAFLATRSRTATVQLEDAREGFARVWDLAGFIGDRDAALAEWGTAHNASGRSASSKGALRPEKLGRVPAKLGRLARKLPDFVSRA